MTQWLGLLATTKPTVFNLHEGCVANDKSKINGFRHLGFWKNVNNAGLDRYLHQILRDNALDIGLYNSLYYCTSCDHGCTSCSHSLRLDALGICALWAQCRLNLCIIQFDEWFQSVLVSFSIKSEAFSREVSLCWQWSNNEVDEVFSDHQQFFSYDQISGNSTKPL